MLVKLDQHHLLYFHHGKKYSLEENNCTTARVVRLQVSTL